MTKFVPLLDRGVLKVSGPDASEFLQGLVTNDVAKVSPGRSILAALLTPQGKIQYEFFISVAQGEGESQEQARVYFLEMARGGLKELFGKLALYKMRADVEIEDLSTSHMVFWTEDKADKSDNGVSTSGRQIYDDPRSAKFGQRAIVDVEQVAAFSEGLVPAHLDDYLLKRIELGVPEGGHDYAFGDTFPHEAGYDLLDGVDFEKGCYVGQEVVSRMQHRSTVRKRIVCVAADVELPDAGSEIRTDSSMIGVLGSHINGRGLALVRLDRAGKAIASDAVMGVDGAVVRLSLPSWANYKLGE